MSASCRPQGDRTIPVSSPPPGPSTEDEDGADPFDAAEGMIDEHLLRALRTQRDAYRQMNWRASVTTRTVRATPLSVVVAPAQRLDW